MNSKTQGNGLLVVLIIVSAIAIGVYSVSDLINSEYRLNKRTEAYIEAKQAAESMIQTGATELANRFATAVIISDNMVSPEQNPLSVSIDFLNLYDNNESNLVIPTATQYNSVSEFFTQDTEIIAGRISNPEQVFINPDEVGNELDQLANSSVRRRTTEIFGKATVDHPYFGEISVHASQFFELREINIFTFAIYYNLPMEIAPGPKMDVYGKVHVNSDAWFQSGRGLNFHDRVSIAGDMDYGRHPDNSMGVNNGEVNFTNGDDVLVNMKKNDLWPLEAREDFPGTWFESFVDGNLVENLGQLAEQIWDGNLTTKANDVEPLNLKGISDYIEDTDPSTPEKESLNNAYTVIQPPLDEINVPSEETDPEGYYRAQALKAAETNKFSNRAGLTIEVAENGSLSYYTYDRDALGGILYESDGSPQKRTVTPSDEIASYKPFNSSNGEVQSGLRDNRQGQDMNLIEVDVSKLKTLVEDNNESDWGDSKPEDWWTGIVYVQFPQENATSTRPDNVNPAKSANWGVKLVRGQQIPNPEFASSKGIYGTTIATNQQMYVEGHYNADGNLSTGSPTQPDDPNAFNKKDGEAPAALVADAITFLSANWNDSNSNKSLSDRTAAATEVSAAILTGLVPSGENGTNSYSGGVENFPRFLENWGGKDFIMRGSIVALFESEVATAPWGSGNVYSAPRREWGFHSNYIDTPPIGLYIPSYRVRDLRILSEDEYRNRVLSNWQ